MDRFYAVFPCFRNMFLRARWLEIENIAELRDGTSKKAGSEIDRQSPLRANVSALFDRAS
jgi:hypothetical protein